MMWQRNPISEPYRVTAPNLLNMHFHQHNKASIQCDAVKDTYAFTDTHTSGEYNEKHVFQSISRDVIASFNLFSRNSLSRRPYLYENTPHIAHTDIWAPRNTTYSPIDIEEGEGKIETEL